MTSFLGGARAGNWIAASFCALFLIASALISAAAVRGKSATYDEPVHLVEGWEALYHGDYRLEVTNPPLWKYLAALPLRPDSFNSSFRTTEGQRAGFAGYPNLFAVRTLYDKSNHEADQLLFRARLMMLLIEVTLGAVLAIWAWRLAGPFAAIAATFLLALDPNFLAHASLVKNDVAAALCFVIAAYTLWLIGRRITTLRIIAMGVILGAALCIKLSALLLAPILVLALGGRALASVPWPAWSCKFERRLGKLALFSGLLVLWAAVSICVIWGCYRFRFSVSPDPTVGSNLHNFADLSAEPKPLLVRLALFAGDHRLLPETWLTDIVSMEVVTTQREAFLMGQFSTQGWWYYFPLAFLFKTPLATLVAFALSAAMLAKHFAGRDRPTFDQRWTIACVALPPAIYAVAAMGGALDIGIRHLLPVYPFLFLACGVAFSTCFKGRLRAPVWIGGILALGLAVESLAAFPNYIPFFNLAAGGARGGLALLSDSNIDWGQDLPLLADWQRSHSDTPLYLCYFGVAPPAYYGIHYINLAGSYAPDTPGSEAYRNGKPLDPGVIAISATQLQGTYLNPILRSAYQPLQDQTPIAVLGGSIYLFEVK